MTTIGKILLIVSIIGLVLGLLLTFGLPGYFIMDAAGADEYDSWVESASEGDSMEFVGTIAEREEVLGIWIYKFEGCENGFFGSKGDLEKGDYVYIEIQIHDGLPQVRSELSYVLCGVPGAICSAVMLILLVISIIIFATGKKQDRLAGPTQQPTQDLSHATAVVQQVQRQEQAYYQQQQQQPQHGYGGQQGYGGGAQPPAGGQRMCQRCGGPAQFYPDRNIYWCDRCNQYA